MEVMRLGIANVDPKLSTPGKEFGHLSEVQGLQITYSGSKAMHGSSAKMCSLSCHLELYDGLFSCFFPTNCTRKVVAMLASFHV